MCVHMYVLTVVVADPVGDDDDVACLIGSHNFRGKTVDITRGDYSDLMKRLVDNLQLAKVCECCQQADVVMRPAHPHNFCVVWLLKYFYLSYSRKIFVVL